MSAERRKELLIDVLMDALSGLCIGIALYNFAADAKFPLTGLTGIAMIFYQYWGWKIGIATIIMNIPLIVWAYKVLGKKFLLKSFKTMAIGTVMMDYVAPLIPKVEVGNLLLNALVVGVFTGLGYALVYMRNSSTGGADFIMMIIKAKHPHMSLGRIFFIVDTVIIVIDTIAYAHSFEALCYGFVISYIGSLVVDKVMISADAGMMCMIVTNKAEAIADAIDKAVERGTTIFTAKGGYKGDERQVLMCACSDKQMYQVNRVAKKIDVDAFIVIMESKAVYGEGFKRFKP
ncbi:YitT family protein [Pseudobutyrivibrio xylanivorans]|uniref:YitT family protein n=1 Tax=Pseudobutyrivibrio xylanivorans TaxID=185007 RepID=A0A5P6VP52_PSEXY|nr:YitT family protein [Pseudobutyrivibrio xylanivorans]QFJ54453.1 YitT family protein [Pseudobutyrivibrio xylanivorans]